MSPFILLQRAYHKKYHKDKDPKAEEGYKGKPPKADDQQVQEDSNDQYQEADVPAKASTFLEI